MKPTAACRLWARGGPQLPEAGGREPSMTTLKDQGCVNLLAPDKPFEGITLELNLQ